MIPKRIHYCWFSDEPYPPQIKRCLRSWKRWLPDYELVLWNGSRFDFDSVPYVQKCIALRRWAFAADYIRLYAIYHEGGIYLDSDVEVFKSFNPLLHHKAFWGIDATDDQHYAFPEAAIFGAEKGLPLLQEMLHFYETIPLENINDQTFARLTNVYTAENRSIYAADGTPQLVTAPVVMAATLSQYGFVEENKDQRLPGEIYIYGQPTFLNGKLPDTPQTIAHHHNASSWLFTQRGKLFQFCHHHPFFMPLYRALEYLRLQTTKKR